MLISRVRVFQLTTLCFAISSIQSGYAEVDNSSESVSSTAPSAEQTLKTISVVAKRGETTSEKSKAYIVKKSAGATKLDIATKETPQTVNVVTRQVMDDFNLNNARAVLAATPGVVVQQQETDRTSYSSRGSEISNFQVDGLGMPFDGYNYQNGDIDTYIYDRVEVVKGANGLTSSLGDPGASVSFIRKRPTADFQASGGISYGSWNTRRVEGDISGPLNEAGTIRGRLVVADQAGNSYLDHYSTQKSIFSGVLEADLTDTTLLTIGDYQQNNKPQGNNWGALPLLDQNGQQISYARSYNPVPDWVKWDRTTNNSFIELKQKLAGDWVLKGTYNYIKNTEDSSLVYYYGAPDAAGTGVTAYPSEYTLDQSQQIADINLKGTFPLLGQNHELVVGTSWSKNNDKEGSQLAGSAPSFDWYTWDGQFAKPTFTPSNSDANVANYHQEIKTIYSATRLHLTDDLKLLLGANYTQVNSSGNNYGSDTFYDKSKIIPYAGLTYNITPNYTAYTSYSTIFRPQSGLDTSGHQLAPIDGNAYELGLKGSWLKDRLTGSVAVFDTKQNNFPLRASDSASLIKRYSVGDLHTQGFEMDLAGQITDQINLSLGYTQVRLTDATTGDKTRTYLPSRIFNALATYQFETLPALKVGAGVTWQDKVYQDVSGSVYNADGTVTSYSGTIRQKGYALFNLMANYDVNKHVAVQLNADNVTNTKYLNSFPDGEGFYGAPANYTLGVKFKY